jgi:hypothetical protein
MNLRRVGLWFALLAVGLSLPIHAQSVVSNNVPADGLEIRGTVMQPGSTPGSMLALGGAEIILTEFRLIDNTVTPVIFATVTTDSQGMFRFHPQRLGEYIIDVKLDGYIAGGRTNGPEYTGITSYVSLTLEKPLVEERFLLTRQAELTGRVLDEDNHPVPGLPVRIYARGVVQMFNSVITRQDGTFSAPNLQPGQYVVGVLPKVTGPLVLTSFTDKDLEVIESDYESTFWPGVPDSGSATAWTVSPGASTNLPDLHLRKVPTYRALLSVKADPAVACTETEPWSLMVLSTNRDPVSDLGPADPSVAKIPCRKDLLVLNLRPGEYLLSLSSGNRFQSGAWATQQVEVKDKPVQVTMEMSKGVSLSGQVIPAEGAKLAGLDKLLVVNASTMFAGISLGIANQPPDASGRFVLINLTPGRIQILPYLTNRTGYYVQSIRFNGQVIPNGVFDLLPGSSGTIEVVVDDKPASITASLMDGDKPYQDKFAAVGLLKWPATSTGSGFPLLNQVTWSNGVNPEGSSVVQVTGVAPGEYRAFALRRDDRPKLQDPGVLERVATRSEKVVLEGGGSQSITLKLADLTR